jgi:hypothetical protein
MMKLTLRLTVFHLTMLLIGGCATVPPIDQQHRSCYREGGLFEDTLYLGAQLTTAHPPVPRPHHLAPYPPAAAGEFTIEYDGETYFASGPPVRVLPDSSNSLRFVRTGVTGEIPLYILELDLLEGLRHTLWAPITEDCVFLPFKHESEMRSK